MGRGGGGEPDSLIELVIAIKQMLRDQIIDRVDVGTVQKIT